jgi:MFS family permease
MACFALLAVVGAAGLTSFAPAAAFRTSTVPMMSSPMTRRRQTLEMQAIDTSTGQGAKLPQGPDRDGDEKPPEAAGPGGAAVLILLLLFTTNQWARQLIFYTVDFKATPSADAAFQFMNVDLGFNEAQYGILASIGFAALFSLTSLVAGGLVDRTDTRNLLTSTSVLWTGATVLTGAAGSFNEVLAARMVSGVGQAFANPTAYAILRRLYPPERLASVNGLYASGLYFGGGLAALSVLLDASLGWRQLCVIVGVLGLASAAAVQLTLPPMAPTLDKAPGAAPGAAPMRTLPLATVPVSSQPEPLDSSSSSGSSEPEPLDSLNSLKAASNGNSASGVTEVAGREASFSGAEGAQDGARSAVAGREASFSWAEGAQDGARSAESGGEGEMDELIKPATAELSRPAASKSVVDDLKRLLAEPVVALLLLASALRFLAGFRFVNVPII